MLEWQFCQLARAITLKREKRQTTTQADIPSSEWEREIFLGPAPPAR
jgi:hypothetical protein